MLAKIRHNFSTIYEFIVFIRILFFACTVSLLLKFIKIQTLLSWLTPRKNSSKKGVVSPERIAQYVDSILALQILGLRPNCLNRSLILYRFLHKIGVMVKINFGIRKTDNDIEGHGWLTLNGETYLENNDSSEIFCLIYSYPDSNRTLNQQFRIETAV